MGALWNMWTNSINWELRNESLCILPLRQCVQDMRLHLLAKSLNSGKRDCRTWAWGCPSLLCHMSQVERVEETWLQTLDCKDKLVALLG